MNQYRDEGDLSSRLARLEDDYADACKEIRRLERNVLDARAALTAAEAAGEAVAIEALRWAYANRPDNRWSAMDRMPSVAEYTERGLAALPTPTAALQRVREEEAERALRFAYERGLLNIERGPQGTDGIDEWIPRAMTTLFPAAPGGG